MPEEKRKMTILGQEMEVADVPIVSSTEPFAIYELEDGSTLRVKSAASAILRLIGQKNADGMPIYLVLATPAVTVIKAGVPKE